MKHAWRKRATRGPSPSGGLSFPTKVKNSYGERPDQTVRLKINSRVDRSRAGEISSNWFAGKAGAIRRRMVIPQKFPRASYACKITNGFSDLMLRGETDRCLAIHPLLAGFSTHLAPLRLFIRCNVFRVTSEDLLGFTSCCV